RSWLCVLSKAYCAGFAARAEPLAQFERNALAKLGRPHRVLRRADARPDLGRKVLPVGLREQVVPGAAGERDVEAVAVGRPLRAERESLAGELRSEAIE